MALSKRQSRLIYFGGIILFVVLAVKFSGYGDNDSNSSKSVSTGSDTDKFLAYNLAIDYVKDQLKAPSTAKFPKTIERIDHIEYIGSGRYKINSWVDSQNSLGAMLRTNFSCTMVDKGGGTWGIENLKFEER